MAELWFATVAEVALWQSNLGEIVVKYFGYYDCCGYCGRSGRGGDSITGD